MISLPGLTIVTGRYDVARSILQTFSKYGMALSMLKCLSEHDDSVAILTKQLDFSQYVCLSIVSKGMLPNRFPDDGSAPTEEDYNNADGTVRCWQSRFVPLCTSKIEIES